MWALNSSYSFIKSNQAKIIGFNLNIIKDYIFLTLQKNIWISKLYVLVQSRTDKHQGNSDWLRQFQKALLNKLPPSLNYYSLVLYVQSIHTQRDTHLLSLSHGPAYAEYWHFKTLAANPGTETATVVTPTRGHRKRQRKKEDGKALRQGRMTKSHLRS